MPFIVSALGGWLESGLLVADFDLGTDFFALADFFGEATLVAVFFAVAFFATGFLLVVFLVAMIIFSLIQNIFSDNCVALKRDRYFRECGK
jgi:hypothetical protein